MFSKKSQGYWSFLNKTKCVELGHLQIHNVNDGRSASIVMRILNPELGQGRCTEC
jgi:hypothetical protein